MNSIKIWFYKNILYENLVSPRNHLFSTLLIPAFLSASSAGQLFTNAILSEHVIVFSLTHYRHHAASVTSYVMRPHISCAPRLLIWPALRSCPLLLSFQIPVFQFSICQRSIEWHQKIDWMFRIFMSLVACRISEAIQIIWFSVRLCNPKGQWSSFSKL